MPSLVFWTSANTKNLNKTVGVTLQRLETKPQHKFVQIDGTRYVPEPDELVLAMGKDALLLLAAGGLVPKNRTVDSLEGKVFQKSASEGRYMVSKDPGQIVFDPAVECEIVWAVQLIARLCNTGTLAPKLGSYKWVDDFSDLISRVEAKFVETGKPVPVTYDTETQGKSPYKKGARFVAIGFTDRVGFAECLYITDMKTQEHAQRVHAQVKWLLTTPKIRLRLANAKYDLTWDKLLWGIECTNFSMDTLLVGSLLDENRSNSLKWHVKMYAGEMGGYDDDITQADYENMAGVPKPRMLNYLGADVDGTLRVSLAMQREMQAEPELAHFYINLLHPAAQTFATLEQEGLLVDQQAYRVLRADLQTEIAVATKDALALLPARMRVKYADNLSLTRPSILKDYFFGPMGLNLKPRMTTAKSEGREPSTAKSHLDMFQDVPEAKAMCAALDRVNQGNKALGTYVEGFLKHLQEDGRFHPSYFLHNGDNDWGSHDGGTNTGRVSAIEPAVQTVPKKTKWGKRIRECIISPPGFVLLEADFIQGELKLCACVADEPTMLDSYRQGIDLHCKTGAGMIGMELEEFLALKFLNREKYDLVRSRAKPANFGIIYDISAEGFMAYAWNGYRVKFTLEEATQTVEGFFNTYPELKTWHKRFRQMAKRDGFVKSPLGRIRHLPDIYSPDGFTRSKAERRAINSPIQGCLSDSMEWSLALVRKEYPQYRPCAMIHDAGYWYVPEEDQEIHARRVVDVMSNLPFAKTFGWQPQIPIDAEATLGPNLAKRVEVKLAA